MNSIDSRRKLLKSFVAGSGAVVAGKSLPESWSKPVIDSVILPAHALTTDDTGSAGGGAPTPPPCCLTADTYCGHGKSLGEAIIKGPYIKITVETDGGITVQASYPCDTFSGSTTILCTGGKFTVNAERQLNGNIDCASQEGGTGDTVHVPDSMQIIGIVSCGETSITGTIAFGGTDFSYIATKGECDIK